MKLVKAQSAMEYLMTYGWAILIISIVMAALFSLGVFSKASLSPTACIAASGYECVNAVLNGNNLLATLGQFTGTSWSSVSFYLLNSSVATPGSCSFSGNGIFLGSPSSISTLPSGGTQAESFVISGNMLLGTAYTGTLWATYTASGASLCTQIATISTKVV